MSLGALICPGRVSPTLNKQTDSLKVFTVQSLGQIVSLLKLGVNLGDADCTRADMAPEEMPLDLKVLGSIGNLLSGGKKERSIVVFKDTATDRRLEGNGQGKSSNDLDEKCTQWKHCAHAHAEGGVLSFQSG